jgi:hypothetical protein
MEFFFRIFGISWAKVKRLKKIQGSPTKARLIPPRHTHSLREEAMEFVGNLSREPCHFTLASHALYLTTVDSIFDVFKAWLSIKEPEVFAQMEAARWWGHSISGAWGAREDCVEPKPRCSYDYIRQVFHKFRDGPDKFKFEPRRTDQCPICNAKQDKIRVLRSMGIDTEEKEKELELHIKEQADHLEGADRAYHRLKCYKELSKKSYGEDIMAARPELTAKLARDEGLEPCAWKGGIQYLAMDAGGALRTPLVRANIAYFTRCLQTTPYWIVDETHDVPTVYMWNKQRAAKGSDEVLSALLHWINKESSKIGAEHLFVEGDGCGGQLWNYNAVAMFTDLTHPDSTTFGLPAGKPMFRRADLLRSKVGHTFMTPDRCQGALSRAGYKKDHVANLHEWVSIAKSLKGGKWNVHEVPAACPYFYKLSAYLTQYYETSGQRKGLS